MRWWNNSEELDTAVMICEALGIDAEPTEGSIGAQVVVPADRLEEVLSFVAKKEINFWTSCDSRGIILYIMKRRSTKF